MTTNRQRNGLVQNIKHWHKSSLREIGSIRTCSEMRGALARVLFVLLERVDGRLFHQTYHGSQSHFLIRALDPWVFLRILFCSKKNTSLTDRERILLSTLS